MGKRICLEARWLNTLLIHIKLEELILKVYHFLHQTRNVIHKNALQQLYFALHTFLCFWFTANEHTIKDLIQIRKRNWKTRRVNLGAVSVHACLLLHYVWMAKIIFRILFGYMAMACPLSNIHFADFSTIRNCRCKSTNCSMDLVIRFVCFQEDLWVNSKSLCSTSVYCFVLHKI